MGWQGVDAIKLLKGKASALFRISLGETAEMQAERSRLPNTDR